MSMNINGCCISAGQRDFLFSSLWCTHFREQHGRASINDGIVWYLLSNFLQRSSSSSCTSCTRCSFYRVSFSPSPWLCVAVHEYSRDDYRGAASRHSGIVVYHGVERCRCIIRGTLVSSYSSYLRLSKGFRVGKCKTWLVVRRQLQDCLASNKQDNENTRGGKQGVTRTFRFRFLATSSPPRFDSIQFDLTGRARFCLIWLLWSPLARFKTDRFVCASID